MLKFKDKLEEFKCWVWSEDPSIPNWKRKIKGFCRLLHFFLHEFKENALTLRASALTYIIILSIVPVMAFGTAVLKGLGAENRMKQVVYDFIEEFEEASKKGAQDKSGAEFTAHLRKAVDKVFEYVERTNFAALGFLGILGIIWAMISALSKIEDAMNSIWKTKKGRSWDRRILDYTALMVILPLSLNIVVGVVTASQIGKITRFMDKIIPVPIVSSLFFKSLPILILIGTFSVLYRFLPNTYVKPSSAILGGIVGGISWIIVQFLYVKLQIGVARYNAIYGSFATIPLFLIWIYMGWVMFLAGAEFSFVYQYRSSFNPTIKFTPVLKLATAFDVIRLLYKRFGEGKEFDPSKEAHVLGKPESLVREILDVLEKNNLVSQIKNANYLPSIDLDKLQLYRIVGAVCGEIETSDSFGDRSVTFLMEKFKTDLDTLKKELISEIE